MGATTSCADKCCADGSDNAELKALPHPSASPGIADMKPSSAGMRPVAKAPEIEGTADSDTGGTHERRWGKSAGNQGGLVIGFLLPDGSERTIAFGERRAPLGIDFGATPPCTTKRVSPGGHGEQLGVQPKWVVQYVNGERVVGREVEYVFEAMKRALIQQ
mmetsp:Transcript_34268/g.101807  ORF Transcript_34268/g.101807 Transcript_34268/m.101807 type:complete len:161 (+) Transcript_34268:65-547(+)